MRSLNRCSVRLTATSSLIALALAPLAGCSPDVGVPADLGGAAGAHPDGGSPSDPKTGPDESTGGGGTGPADAAGGSGAEEPGLGSDGATEEPPKGDESEECGPETFDHDGRAETPCRAFTRCEPGQFVQDEGTPSADRSCAECPSGSFSLAYDAPECRPLRVCAPGEHVRAEGSADHNTLCQPCPAGTFSELPNSSECAACPEGSFSAAGQSACAAHRACDWYQVEAVAGTPSHDALCEPGSPFRQFGTAADDDARGVAALPDGGAYVVGATSGELEVPAVGGQDSYLRRYDERGQVVWTRQFGYASDDAAHQVALDGSSQPIVLGTVQSSGDGGELSYLRKYDAEGQLLWHVEVLADEGCVLRHLAVDTGGVSYVAGVVPGVGVEAVGADICVGKVDAEGRAVWSRRAGSELDDGAFGIALGQAGLLVVGSTAGNFAAESAGGLDAFAWSLDGDGADRWVRQFGTAADDGAAAAVVGPATMGLGTPTFYVAGWTRGDLAAASAGEADLFLRAIAEDGTEGTTTQLGGERSEIPVSLVVSGLRLTLAARVEGPDGGGRSDSDGRIYFFRSPEVLRLERSFGTSMNDFPLGLAAAPPGRVYVVGATEGALVGESLGQTDAFVARLELSMELGAPAH